MARNTIIATQKLIKVLKVADSRHQNSKIIISIKIQPNSILLINPIKFALKQGAESDWHLRQHLT
jgi:hypothetical protein